MYRILIALAIIFSFSNCSSHKRNIKSNTDSVQVIKRNNIELARDSSILDYKVIDSTNLCLTLLEIKSEYDTTGKVKTKTVSKKTLKKQNNVKEMLKNVKDSVVVKSEIVSDSVTLVKKEEAKAQPSIKDNSYLWIWILLGIAIAIYLNKKD